MHTHHHNLISTYNHWSIIYNVTRTDASQPLQACQDTFKNIIDQCIRGDTFWGGSWSAGGFTYAIYNKDYPANPLGPTDAGGPTSTAGITVPPGATIVTETNATGATIVGTVSSLFSSRDQT